MARNDRDMLSSLPEELVLKVVSSLPFKEAARTCTLSKKWSKSKLWRSTSNIDFNELDFVKINESSKAKVLQRRVYLNFIEKLIGEFKDGLPVNKFSVKVSDPESCRNTIESCVAFATQHGTKELGLDFTYPEWKLNGFGNNYYKAMFELPKHAYGHGELESLKLHSCSFVMPDLLNFWALKEVSFGWMKVSALTLRTLLSTCKLIESLTLEKCYDLEHFDMGEERLGLTKLVLDKCRFQSDYFEFNAPHLKFFKHYAEDIGDYEINVRPHVMEEADIDFGLVSKPESESEYYYYANLLYKLLLNLYPVKVLTVCGVLLQIVPCGDEPVKVQLEDGLNVRHLIMKTQMHSNEMCGVMFLLRSCPNLEKLTLDLGLQKILPDYEAPYDVNLARFWNQVGVVSCLSSTLKVVELKGFRGTRHEVAACCYFIRYGRVLEKLSINVLKEQNAIYPETVEQRRACARRLLTKAKTSLKLEISIE